MENLIVVDKIRGYIANDGTAYLNLEDISKGLGFVETKGDYVRWQRVYGYLEDFGFSTSGEKIEYVPENIFYRLAMKAKNEAAEIFQAKVADEILPSIRRTGAYQKPMSELEILAGSIKQLIEHNKRINALEEKQQIQSEQISSIKEVAAYHPDNEWRENTKKLINKMVDGNFEKIREIRKEAYNLLENRMNVLLETRLRNKRRRLLEEGVSRTKANELNYLDVIADDKKLIEGFVAIIKEMSIKYGVVA